MKRSNILRLVLTEQANAVEFSFEKKGRLKSFRRPLCRYGTEPVGFIFKHYWMADFLFRYCHCAKELTCVKLWQLLS